MPNYTKEELLDVLNSLLAESANVKSTIERNQFGEWMSKGVFDGWRTKITYILQNSNLEATDTISKITKLSSKDVESIECVEAHLRTLIDLLSHDYIQLSKEQRRTDSQQNLNLLFNRFHKISRQLRDRYDNRNTISIDDEYDVQDLLHALLLLFFDDVRPEEWSPSYAGGAVRMDFLLKEIDTVIEVKKTRKSMTSKDLGEQLIIDIEKYQEHPNCKQLCCFVYDPEGLLGNPTGIKNDLETRHAGFLKVYIKPE